MVPDRVASGANFAPPVPRRRWRLRWLGAGGVALLLPKCVGCLLGYAALAGGPELCGAIGSDHRWLAAGAAGVAVTGAVFFARRVRSRE